MTKKQFKKAKKTIRDVNMTKRYYQDRSESYDRIAWVIIIASAVAFILWGTL